MKYQCTLLTLMFFLSFPAIGQTNISLEASMKFIDINFSAQSEDSIDEQIHRTKKYIETLKKRLPRNTEQYEEYLREHSLPPTDTSADYEREIRQLEKIKELLDLQLETKLLHAQLTEISRKHQMLPTFSPNGLRNVKDLSEALDILSTAKKLVLFGDDVPGDWKESQFGCPESKVPTITLEDKHTIESISKFLNSCEFKYSSEMTQSFLQGDALSTCQVFLVEIDNKAHIVLLSDMMICDQKKTYFATKYKDNNTTSFGREFALLLPLEEYLTKDSQPAH